MDDRQPALWRGPVENLDATRIAAVAGFLEQVLAFNESRWSAAVAGDAAAAISLAVDAFVLDQPATMPRHLALSALWLCAASGDPAADLTLRFLKSRLGACS
jgi:hypothetical protein